MMIWDPLEVTSHTIPGHKYILFIDFMHGCFAKTKKKGSRRITIAGFHDMTAVSCNHIPGSVDALNGILSLRARYRSGRRHRNNGNIRNVIGGIDVPPSRARRSCKRCPPESQTLGGSPGRERRGKSLDSDAST